ncbi:MAG: glycosyltransferase [Eikenella sp.]|nr:glycosyltransferase [Eikenella sp.]
MIPFSVLMSLYIREEAGFLQQCLDSLCQQTLPADEVVLVLDGEITEELQTIVDAYQAKLPMKVVPLPQNIGLGKALNKGLQHCSHDWVFRMDTDDVCTPDRFEKQVRFIENNQDVVLFGGVILEFNQAVNDLNIVKSVPVSNQEIVEYAKQRCPFNHMTVAYRKDVVVALGGYQHHLFMEDYNLWLRIIGAGHTVANMSDILVYARVGNGMHQRRRGWPYIKSEKQLLDLKLALNIQPALSAYAVFLVRAGLRVLPSSLLAKFYSTFLRKES